MTLVFAHTCFSARSRAPYLLIKAFFTVASQFNSRSSGTVTLTTRVRSFARSGPAAGDLMCMEVNALIKTECPEASETGPNYKHIYCGKPDKEEMNVCKGDSGSGVLKKEQVKGMFNKKKIVDILYGVLISGHGECEDKFVFF
ncbi:trypsin II-P29-like [Astyanax mexicanus]|uniref:Trypsin II-P29-like n=1 Tax=Astyanax mexicanus TaxID=7994 RepID=A0A8T2L268_ASTMX|nr:trypsin II-P29-like [Astyanax mexicanus]